MTFTESIKSLYHNYTQFDGRSSRSAYWWVVLYQAIVVLPLAFLLGVGVGMGSKAVVIICGLLLSAFVLANIVPCIALAVRRLHDTGRSGWWYLVSLIPYIGSLWFTVLSLLPSTPEPNLYGEHPDDIY